MARGEGETGPHPVDRHVGRRVSEKRLSLGYNQSDLGRALGLTFQQIQKYEKGSNRISASKLWEIADFFSVDIEYFYAGLVRDASDPTASGADLSGLAFPPTRSTLEIARLTPRLTTRQQKLALELMKSMLGADDETDPVD